MTEKDRKNETIEELLKLNTDRTILDTVGRKTLKRIAEDTLDLLGSSVVIYEKNGDYAMALFSSSWCNFLHSSSRNLCGNCSTRIALKSGKWLCNDSCWTCSKEAFETGRIVDKFCEGGIKRYSIPILAGEERIGVLSVAYGEPPKDEQTLKRLAEKYKVDLRELRIKAGEYSVKDNDTERIAKNRMATSAKLIGLIVESRQNENRLREARNRFNLAIEGSGLGTWQWNAQTDELVINERWATMLGYTKKELEPTTFETWERLTHPDDLKTSKTIIDKHFQGKTKNYRLELRMKHKNGNWVWVFDKGKVFERTPDGKPLMMFGTHQDITQKKQTQEELEKFFSINLDLLCITDSDGNFIRVNMAWEEILGYTKEEIERKNFLDFIHPDDLQGTLKTMEVLKKDIQVNGFINRYKTTDGEYRFLEWNSTPSGDVIYGAARDITDKITAQEALKESEQKYRLAFKHSPVGIINFDKDGRITDTNDRLLEILGTSRDAILGVELLSSPDKQLVKAVKKALNGKNGFYDGVYQNITSKKAVPAVGIVTSVQNAEGEFMMGLGIIEDVTRQKNTEAALIKAKEEAQLASKAKSDFLANMSHEIRTPINGVIGFSEILKSTPLNEDQIEYNDIVLHSARLLLGIINDILDFSKIEAGKLELNLEKTSLLELIESTMSIFTYASNEKGIELIESISRAVPEFIITDSLRLKQVLMNLLSNAIKFTSSGEVELIVRKIEIMEEKKRARLKFSVKDTGIGIEEKHKKAILEPFNQGDYRVTHKFGGTGLGLAITKSLLEKMGSILEIESTFDEGSTFSFELEVEYADFAVEKRETDSPEEDTKKLKKLGKTVLIVEDNVINMQYVESVLKMADKSINIIKAFNGKEALELFESTKPQLILLDIQLPDIDGYAVTQKIRETDKDTPIIAITAQVVKGEDQRAKKAGMTDYLPKPVSVKTLSDILKRY